MLLGCFGFIRNISDIETAGFDEAELDIGEINSLTTSEYLELIEKSKNSRLNFHVFSGLIPLSVRFLSDDFNSEYWLDYVRRGVERVARLGAIIIPFGAGKCRSIPIDYKDKIGAYEIILNIVRDICSILNDYGIDMAIEPLGPTNSNFLNKISEAAVFAQKCGSKNCYIMCDMRHMYASGDDMDEIVKYKNSIIHAHIDYPLGNKRYFPKYTDKFNYAPFFKGLAAIHYSNCLTIEATDFDCFHDEAILGRILLRKYLAAYK